MCTDAASLPTEPQCSAPEAPPSYHTLYGSGAGLAAWIIAFGFAVGSYWTLVQWLSIDFDYEPNSMGIVTPWTIQQYPNQSERFYYYFGVVWTALISVLLALAWAIWARRLSYLVRRVRQASTVATLCMLPLVQVPFAMLYCHDGLKTVLMATLLSTCLAVLTARFVLRRASCAPTSTIPLVTPMDFFSVAVGGFCAGMAIAFQLRVTSSVSSGILLLLTTTTPFFLLITLLLWVAAGRSPPDERVLRRRLSLAARFFLPWMLLLYPDVWFSVLGSTWMAFPVVSAAGVMLCLIPFTGDRRCAQRVFRVTLAFLMLAVVIRLRAPWELVHAVLAGAPETVLLHPSFVSTTEYGFRAETAWRIAHNQYQGKDFYCLYGPLYSIFRAWTGMLLGGRYLFGVALWNGAARVFGISAFALIVWTMTRHRLWTGIGYLAALTTFSGSARLGFPFAVGACLFHAFDSRRAISWILTGFTLGLSLSYSQEFGLSALVVLFLLATVYAVRTRAIATAKVCALVTLGMALVLIPLCLYFRSGDALAPMLRDLVEYPRLVNAGYGFLPMPPFAAAVATPGGNGLGLNRFSLYQGGLNSLFYLLPAIAVAGGTLFLRRLLADRWRLSAFSIRLGYLSGMALLTVHTMLGRSDSGHVVYLIPWALLLLILACRSLATLTSQRPRALAIGTIVVTLTLFVPVAELLKPFDDAQRSLAAMPSLLTPSAGDYVDGSLIQKGEHDKAAIADMKSVIKKVRSMTTSADRVCYWPLHAVLNYLSRRFDTGRFSILWFVITDEHRREIMASLTSAPPTIIVLYRYGTDVGDGIPISRYTPLVWRFLVENYTQVDRIGDFTIHRYEPPLEHGDTAGTEVSLYRLDGAIPDIPDLARRRPILVARTRDVAAVPDILPLLPISAASIPLKFCLRWEADLRIDLTGAYTFITRSDDGSRLYIDDRLVVDNGGIHASQERRGTVLLSPGYHHLEITYVQAGGGMACVASWIPPNGSAQRIPPSHLKLHRPGTTIEHEPD